MSSSQSEVSLSMPGLDDSDVQRLTKDVASDPEKVSIPEKEQAEARQIHGLKWLFLCAAIYLTAFLYGLDTTIAADVQGPVVETFGDVSQLTWLGSGFPLGSVAVILLLGSLYGNFDQKWLYIGSLTTFEIGSILCGASPNMNAIIVGRVIAGIGGAGIYLGALNYFSEMTSPTERGAYISGIGLVWGLGTICGPLIGGAFSDSSATWRWAFYINAPLGAIFAPVFLMFLPSIKLGNGTVLSRLSKIDWIGFILSVAVWCTFTVSFTFAGNLWSWNDGRTITLVVIFGVLLVAFGLHQTFTKGMLPVYLFRSRTQILLYIATSAATATMFVPLYFLPLYFQFVAGDSALLAAVRILPFIAVFVVFNMLGGVLLPKIGYYAVYYLVGGLSATAGGAALLTVTAETSKSAIYGYSVLVALGTGLTAQIGYTVATIEASKISGQAIVDAISLQNFSQIGSIVIALVVSGQIFQSLAFRNLSAVLVGFTDEQIKSAVAGSSSPVFMSLTEDVRQQAIQAIISAMGDVYSLVIVAGALLVLSSLAMKRERIA
ncbi:MAG: hypothetical protein GOMPHAMPRED_005994 [Gomphillus americanus]|uniref:Major facilitator superfamily (MFS) profile domain-containing protein n=1 Tax=Gomphillus americanus TaxID=1940652 RepID=A0A8H3EJF4_9LECA|nr:MAG: hypothetical protein GOMPHAMPRED_005994 [Gomphillus americanus]